MSELYKNVLFLYVRNTWLTVTDDCRIAMRSKEYQMQHKFIFMRKKLPSPLLVPCNSLLTIYFAIQCVRKDVWLACKWQIKLRM